MNKYTFKSCCAGDLVARCHMEQTVTVEAPTESAARYAAMVKRWGAPKGQYSTYHGLGLELISFEPDRAHRAEV